MKYQIHLLLVLLPVVVNAVSSPWLPSEKDDLFVPFPQEVQHRLNNELELYKTKKEELPVVRVFQKYPESPTHRVWPQMKSVHRRLYPILWPRVQYYVKEGLKFGCRQINPNSTSEGDATHPVTTTRCHRHCLHQGRYCLDEPALPPDHRRAALKEIMRRLCMDTIYHAKDPRYISYLEHFDTMGCTGHPESKAKPLGGFRNCSLTAMNLAGMRYSDITSCMAEDKFEKDVPSNVMNRNLRQLDKHSKFNYTLPYVTFNNNKLSNGPMNTKTIFRKYCSLFPSLPEQPLACHACKDCSNVRECLWTLKCDGRKFNPNNLKPEVLSLTVPPNSDTSNVKTQPPTAAAAGEANDVSYHQKDQQPQRTKAEDVSSSHGLALEMIAILFVAGVGFVAFTVHYKRMRKQRAKKRLNELATGKRYSDGVYRDNPAGDDDEQQHHDHGYTDAPFDDGGEGGGEEKMKQRAEDYEDTIEWVEAKKDKGLGSGTIC